MENKKEKLSLTNNDNLKQISQRDNHTKLIFDNILKLELETLFLEGSTYKMRLKSYPFEVILGNANTLNEKIEKLKVFCAFQNVQDTLSGYEQINLTYSNQVVATTP